MKRTKILLVLLCGFILLAAGCNRKDTDKNPQQDQEENIGENTEENSEEEQMEDSEEDIQIQSMTLRDKLGQLFIVGFEGKDIDEDTRHLIQDFKIGGVIFFGRNIENAEQVLELTNKLKDLNRDNEIPLFISTDEEGGKVSRLPKEFARLPEAVSIGNADNLDLSFRYGELMGLRLKTLGFNLNYAPVMDINSNPSNPVIGNRALGNNPEIVSKHGVQMIKGMKSIDIIPTLKHFPGHGDTSVDSHVGLPVVNKSLEEIKKFELVPFKRGIDEGVGMVMIAHILFPEISGEYPSTMSKEIMEDVLRGELGFDGVIISDDLTMGAITKNYTLEEATFKFLESGGDIALICHGIDNVNRVYEYIEDRVENGDISMEDIDEKVRRVIELKKEYGLEDRKIETLDMKIVEDKTNEMLNILK